MVHGSSHRLCLFGSLFTLTAVCVVTSVALTGWTQGISDRLLGTAAYDEAIDSGRIVGGLVKWQADTQTGPAPIPVYRPANERLPSQMPPPSDDYLDVYGHTAAPTVAMIDDQGGDLSQAIDSDTITETGAPTEEAASTEDDPIAQQAAILAEMRFTSGAEPDALRN